MRREARQDLVEGDEAVQREDDAREERRQHRPTLTLLEALHSEDRRSPKILLTTVLVKDQSTSSQELRLSPTANRQVRKKYVLNFQTLSQAIKSHCSCLLFSNFHLSLVQFFQVFSDQPVCPNLPTTPQSKPILGVGGTARSLFPLGRRGVGLVPARSV